MKDTQTNNAERTAKSCGPGIPMLMPCPVRVRIVAETGARQPVPGESTYKPSNHRAGKAGMSQPNLWFLPRAIFPHGGHGGGELPVFPAPSGRRRDKKRA